MSATVGQKAPIFELPDTDKKTVNLESFKGKNVVLLFFPAAFTSTCTKEMCQTRDELSFFNGLNAEVFGISVDMPFTLAKYKEANQLNFPLLSDFNKEAITAYGCKYDNWILGLKGVAKRSSFVIDKEGTIRFAQVLENASDYPDFDGIKKALEGLK
ncbi:MAG TPA: peroxiredoxin [Bacteroidia bacterium]|jgi:peroxiredoxin|nr:peroxiredoxin [Bacteroidia bacterium]